MLEAVQVVHDQRIVHSDLKPANFLLVDGQLKLIDFGIAKAINNDTTNIQREHQIGTLSYMAPEAVSQAHTGILCGIEHFSVASASAVRRERAVCRD